MMNACQSMIHYRRLSHFTLWQIICVFCFRSKRGLAVEHVAGCVAYCGHIYAL